MVRVSPTDDATATAPVEPSDPAAPSVPITKGRRRGWLLEIVGMTALYQLYEQGRELAAGSTATAFRNARELIDLERSLGIYWERPIQEAFLSADWFIAGQNLYYGTIHFGLPLIALVALYRLRPDRYVRWRNTLVAMWAVAVLTFVAYPLMPPRLMPARFGFVDTAAEYFNLGPQYLVDTTSNGLPSAKALAQYANPYAAMPSFHIGWSTWSVLALWPLVRRRWVRALLVVYPFTVLFCITVTANHWLLDAAGGVAVLGLGYAVASALEVGLRRRRARLRARTGPDPGSAASG